MLLDEEGNVFWGSLYQHALLKSEGMTTKGGGGPVDGIPVCEKNVA